MNCLRLFFIPVFLITFVVQPIVAYGQQIMASGQSIPRWTASCDVEDVEKQLYNNSLFPAIRQMHNNIRLYA